MLYRSSAFSHTSPEFKVFLSNFTNLYSKIKNENPYASFFTDDFNGHSPFWWPDGNTTSEGRELENHISTLNLSQLISEPTNFEPNINPSCIDLVITNQPNRVLDCGTRASLDYFCHQDITYCKVNFNIPLLKRSMFKFPWLQHLNINQDPNCQVKTFTKFSKNIMANFIPNEIKKIIPLDNKTLTNYA